MEDCTCGKRSKFDCSDELQNSDVVKLVPNIHPNRSRPMSSEFVKSDTNDIRLQHHLERNNNNVICSRDNIPLLESTTPLSRPPHIRENGLTNIRSSPCLSSSPSLSPTNSRFHLIGRKGYRAGKRLSTLQDPHAYEYLLTNSYNDLNSINMSIDTSLDPNLNGGEKTKRFCRNDEFHQIIKGKAFSVDHTSDINNNSNNCYKNRNNIYIDGISGMDDDNNSNNNCHNSNNNSNTVDLNSDYDTNENDSYINTKDDDSYINTNDNNSINNSNDIIEMANINETGNDGDGAIKLLTSSCTGFLGSPRSTPIFKKQDSRRGSKKKKRTKDQTIIPMTTVKSKSMKKRHDGGGGSRSGQKLVKQPPTTFEDKVNKVLKKLEILDTEAEKCYDAITSICSKTLDIPICLITLVDYVGNRIWFKSKYGLDVQQIDLGDKCLAFCAQSIEQKEDSAFVVENAALHPVFKNNPLVTGAMGLRFYAGYALKARKEGVKFGNLCLLDVRERTFAAADCEILRNLAEQVVNNLELTLSNRKLALKVDQIKILKKKEDLHRKLELEKTIAEESNQRLTKFIAYLSHETRNQLAPLQCIVQDTSFELETDKKLMLTSIATIDRILKNVLLISKLNSGKADFPQELFRLGEFLESTESYGSKIVKSPVKFSHKVTCKDGDLSLLSLQVNGYKTIITQVISNFLSNSQKFTADGVIALNWFIERIKSSPSVGIPATSSRVVSKKGFGGSAYGLPEVDCIRMVINIIDTGCGIEQDDIEKVFEEYGQARTGASQGSGTGLGLPLSKKMVEYMGGSFALTSVCGQGTQIEMILEIPIFIEKKLKGLSEKFSWIPQTIRNSGFTSDVLAVDDNLIIQKLYARKAGSLGMTVSLASDGFEVLQLVRNRETFGIVLLDMEMPNMNGDETCQKMRQMGYQGIIVLVTGSAYNSSDFQHLKSLGFDFVCIKGGKPSWSDVLTVWSNRIMR